MFSIPLLFLISSPHAYISKVCITQEDRRLWVEVCQEKNRNDSLCDNFELLVNNIDMNFFRSDEMWKKFIDTWKMKGMKNEETTNSCLFYFSYYGLLEENAHVFSTSVYLVPQLLAGMQ